MVEWGRLLSGYWGEILSRRFESCPPRHYPNALDKGAFHFKSFLQVIPTQPPTVGVSRWRVGRDESITAALHISFLAVYSVMPARSQDTI